MTSLTLDHLDLISRAHDSLHAMANFIDDKDDVDAAGTACILMQICSDLDRIRTEAAGQQIDTD